MTKAGASRPAGCEQLVGAFRLQSSEQSRTTQQITIDVPLQRGREDSAPSSSNLYAAHWFNDSGRGNARFSPIACGARVVPSLHAANSLAGALMETVLHDVPYPFVGHDHDLERDLASNLRASTIIVSQPIRAVDLTKLGLQRMGIRTPHAVVPAGPEETRRCAIPRCMQPS